MSWLKIAPGKSGAREVAVSLLFFWVVVTGWMLWIRETPAPYENMYGTVTTAIFTFVLGAFGVAAVMGRLQGGPPGPPPQVPLDGHKTGMPRGPAARQDDPD